MVPATMYGRRLPKRVQDGPCFGSVMTQRDCIAVVDVPDRNPNDVGLELRSGATRGSDRVGREAQIEEPDPMSRSVERRSNASETVRHHRVRLSLAIGAHEKNPRAASFG